MFAIKVTGQSFGREAQSAGCMSERALDGFEMSLYVEEMGRASAPITAQRTVSMRRRPRNERTADTAP
jgi:hypothetical protein